MARKTKKGSHVMRRGNPFISPKGDLCFVDTLPPELLSRIFEFGPPYDGMDDEDDVPEYWDNLRRQADRQDALENVVKTETIVQDEDQGGDWRTDDGSGSSVSVSQRLQFPIVVSRVCHFWRDTAILTPSLWTAIKVAPEARIPYKRESTLLERSGNLPVDVSVNYEDDSGDVDAHPSDTDIAFLFAMLTPHIHRCRSIEVSVSKFNHMYLFLKAASDPSISAAPHLKTLDLCYNNEPEDFQSFQMYPSTKDFVVFGGSAPLLSKIVLVGVHVNWDLPWIASTSNLTDLELAFHPEDLRPSWAQFASILRSAPALEVLYITQSGPSGNPSEWPMELTGDGGSMDVNGPIQLPHVNELGLIFLSPPCVLGLLRRLYLPSVRHMHLHFRGDDYTDVVHELVRPTISVPLPGEPPYSLLGQLDRLKIVGLPCRTECAEMLYGELDRLDRLELSLSESLPRTFLDILSKRRMSVGRRKAWLPNLMTLYVSGVSGDVLRELVKSRNKMRVSLHSLYVEEQWRVDQKDEEWFKEQLVTFEYFEI